MQKDVQPSASLSFETSTYLIKDYVDGDSHGPEQHELHDLNFATYLLLKGLLSY